MIDSSAHRSIVSPFQSLRSSLSFLEEKGELLRITRKVKPEFELAAVIESVQKTINKAVYFESVEGCEGGVASNLCGSYQRIAYMLSCDTRSIAGTWMSRFGTFKKQEHPVRSKASYETKPFHVSDLPALVFHEKDGGPYITAGIVLVKDQNTGTINLSFHRAHLTGTDELGFRMGTLSGHLFMNQKMNEAQGKPLECAILIGSSPLLMLAATTTMSSSESELDLAAHLLGAPWPMRKCRTMDLDIPEDTEVVIEGEILPNERRMEGPFGEWMGFYTARAPQHVFKVRTIYGRNNPVYYGILPASTEDVVLQGVPIAGSMLKAIRVFVPSVSDVVVWPNLRFCVIQIKKEMDGQERKALLAALGAELNRILYAVIVDEDVDIRNPSDVIWAISTRCRPDRDIFIIPEVPSSTRDPFQRHMGRMGIDATVSLELAKEFERKKIPMSEHVRWEDYV